MKKFNLFILGLCMIVLATSCTRINPTEAGFRVSNSGDYRGVDSLPLLTGWQFTMPTQNYIVTIPTTMQHVVWSEGEQEGSDPNEHITINCMGGSGFKVDIGLNYRVMPSKASKIYLKYKMDNIETITNTFLRNIVRGSMQDISGYMTVDSMLNNLPGYETSVRKDLSGRFEKEGFILDGFNIISKPRPDDPALAKAINDKIIAKQNAETSKQQLEGSIAEANKKVATARGDSAESVIRAAGKAKAIQLEQSQITPLYVDYIKWLNADPNVPRVPVTMLGSNSNTLFKVN
jgi:regulator of protease activity HflC (stomatin/prohibitin superfamily)